MIHVYIAGCRGVPQGYGGYESFVDKLITYQRDESLQYHVACVKGNGSEQVSYRSALCMPQAVPSIGAAKAIYYDIAALRAFIRDIRARKVEHAIVYILACRIGPFMARYVRKLHKLGATVCINPDGHEWMRGKWNALIRKYWKQSERLMVKSADLVICDCRAMQSYIMDEYAKYAPSTTFIAYGADASASDCPEAEYLAWCEAHGLTPDSYYLIVGRFVPENNYELAIREFMAAKTDKPLVIISNVEHNRFYEELRERTGFERDARVMLPGTVYEKALIKRIREGAVAYLHGHEVGGTNPSLLEALASTKVNLLLDVNFNREVGGDGALFFTKERGSLKALIERVERMEEAERAELDEKSLRRVLTDYRCEDITEKYESLWRKLAGRAAK